MVIRFIVLTAGVMFVHLFDGLGLGAAVFGFLIGLLAVRFYWLLLPAAGLANLSNLIYAENTGPGKMEGALGVFPVEFLAFLLLTGFGYAIGVWVRVVLAWRVERLKSLGGAETGAATEKRAAQAQAEGFEQKPTETAPTAQKTSEKVEGDASR